MTDADRLVMLKTDLGLSAATTKLDGRLLQFLHRAAAELSAKGITLADDVRDNELIVNEAAWRWRSRDTMAARPRGLQLDINDRIFSEKMRKATNG